MALTRAAVESILVNDRGLMLGRAGMAVTTTGTNANLNWPIGKAMLYLGLAPADLTAVTDTDLGRVPAGKTLYFLALCDVFTAEAILGNVQAKVDTQVGINRLSLQQMAQALEQEIARLWAQVQQQFVRGRAQVYAGKMAPDPQPPDAYTTPWVNNP